MAVKDVLPGTQITADFNANGALSGNTSCNNYSGTYQTGVGNVIVVSNVVSGKAVCPSPEAQTQEANYLKDIALVSAYIISGNQMTMNNAQGQTLLVLGR
jgi:heat shock protein HslJ